MYFPDSPKEVARRLENDILILKSSLALWSRGLPELAMDLLNLLEKERSSMER